MDAYRLGISDAGAVASKAFVVTASLHANTCGFAEDTCGFRRAAGTLGQINNQYSYFYRFRIRNAQAKLKYVSISKPNLNFLLLNRDGSLLNLESYGQQVSCIGIHLQTHVQRKTILRVSSLCQFKVIPGSAIIAIEVRG